jgi:hypothetical protein
VVELKVFWHSCQNSTDYTAKTQYRKFETNIPRKGTARLQSQFLYSCFCEKFIHFSDRSACFACRNVEIWTEAAQFLFWEYINSNFFAVYSITGGFSPHIFFCGFLLPTRSQIKHNVLRYLSLRLPYNIAVFHTMIFFLDELRTEQETTAHNDNVRRQAEAQIKELQIKVTI